MYSIFLIVIKEVQKLVPVNLTPCTYSIFLLVSEEVQAAQAWHVLNEKLMCCTKPYQKSIGQNFEFQNTGHDQVYLLQDLPHVQWLSMKVCHVDVTGLTDADQEYNRLTMDLRDLVTVEVEDNREVISCQ